MGPLFLSETVMTEAAGSLTYPAQCSSIKKGGYVVIKDRPCKVVETSTSKTGKHGHAKVNMMVPNVNRTEYTLLDISDDGFLSLLLSDGSTKEDLRLPTNDDGDKIRELFDAGKEVIIAVLSAMGIEEVKGFKEGSN